VTPFLGTRSFCTRKTMLMVAANLLCRRIDSVSGVGFSISFNAIGAGAVTMTASKDSFE